MTFQQFSNKYADFFFVTAQKTAINPAALLSISYVLSLKRPENLKYNNFFAIARNGVFNKYATPFLGIESGINLIINNPKFVKYKIGTLKANPTKQFEKICDVLDVVQ